MTKTEIPGAAVDRVAAAVKALNPGARLHRSALECLVQPSDLGGADIYDLSTKSEDVLGWLNAEAYQQAGEAPHEDNHESPPHHGHQHDINRHNAEIGSFCLIYSEPLHWEHVSTWLDALVMAHGDQLLRVKGILSIVGREKPIVVQAVQRLFHPPFELTEWPAGERHSRIVFITRALSRDFIVEVLDTIRRKQIAPAQASN